MSYSRPVYTNTVPPPAYGLAPTYPPRPIQQYSYPTPPGQPIATQEIQSTSQIQQPHQHWMKQTIYQPIQTQPSNRFISSAPQIHQHPSPQQQQQHPPHQQQPSPQQQQPSPQQRPSPQQQPQTQQSETSAHSVRELELSKKCQYLYSSSSLGFHSNVTFGSQRLKQLLIDGYIRNLTRYSVPRNVNALLGRFYNDGALWNINWNNIDKNTKLFTNIYTLNNIQFLVSIEPQIKRNIVWIGFNVLIPSDVYKLKIYFNIFCYENGSEIKEVEQFININDKWIGRTYNLALNCLNYSEINLRYFIDIISVSYDPWVYGNQYLHITPNIDITQRTKYQWNTMNLCTNDQWSDNFGIDNNWNLRLNSNKLTLYLLRMPSKIHTVYVKCSNADDSAQTRDDDLLAFGFKDGVWNSSRDLNILQSNRVSHASINVLIEIYYIISENNRNIPISEWHEYNVIL